VSAEKRDGLRVWPLGRTKYALLGMFLALLTAVLPISFTFTGGPAGWLMLFTARAQDIGKPAWNLPALAVVGFELLARVWVPLMNARLSTTATGYAAICVLVVHAVFAIAIGLQPTEAIKA
jgi:hypothetical protein